MAVNPIEAEQICRSAESALRRGNLNLNQFPGLLKRVIDEQLWKRRRVPGLGIVELPSLRELIESKPLRGWGEDVDRIEAVIRDDAETLRLFRTELKAPGRRTDLGHNMTDVKPRLKGTSRAYLLDRLKRERSDLYEQVVQKKLSAHAAAIQAGIIKPKTPLDELRRWWRKASRLERELFHEEIHGDGTTCHVTR